MTSKIPLPPVADQQARQPDWDPSRFTDAAERKAQMAQVRAQCPVAYSPTRGGQWSVTRYKDLIAVASDPETFSNCLSTRYERALPPLEVDPPVHAVFRQALQRFWLPSRIRALEPVVRAASVSLIEPLLARSGGDLARDYAYPLPVLGLCALLGVSNERWQDIKTWAEDSLEAESDDPVARERAYQAHLQLFAHAREIVAERKSAPRDPESDIASALLSLELDGRPIEDEVVAGVLRLLISAGHNSTTNAMGNVLLFLASTPDAQARLRADPGQIPIAIEELLRFESPVQEMPRYARRDVELSGRLIQAGERLGMMWGSGNLDDEAFERADECIIDRRPNRHLAFGYGIHSCLGAPMARMELRVAIETLFAHTRGFALAGEAERKPYHHFGVSRLPVAFQL